MNVKCREMFLKCFLEYQNLEYPDFGLNPTTCVNCKPPLKPSTPPSVPQSAYCLHEKM